MKITVNRQKSMNTNSFDLNKTALEQKKSCGRYQKDFRRLSAFFIVFIIMISVLAMPAFARAKAEDGGDRNDGQTEQTGQTSQGSAATIGDLLSPGSDTSAPAGTSPASGAAPSAGSDSTEPAVAEIDTFAENPCITWFVRGIPGKVKSAEVYIGAEQVEVAEAGRLIDGEGLAPKTLILVDNSLSIGTKGNQEKIKSILTRLIWNHQYDERFALKTFSDKSVTVMDYTDNYDELRLAVNGITFEDQKTSLRNVLYEEITNLINDGEEDYSRIIIVSDGTDDSRLGMTYEELMALVESDNGVCPIYTIGCFYQYSEDILDQLFALSRLTGSPYFSMDDYETAEDAAAIADGIRADGDDITYFRFSLPPELKDGSQKGVGLIVHTASGDYTIEHPMIMPRGTAKEMQELNEQIRAAKEEEEKKRQEEEEAKKKAEEVGEEGEEEEEEVEEEVPRTALDRFLDNRYVQLLLVPCLLLLFMLYQYLRDRRKSDVPFQEVAPAAPAAAETPESGPAEPQSEGGSLVLFNPEMPGEVYRIRNGQELVIGRSAARSDIAFPDDPMLAARHALIRMNQGRAFLDSLGHRESTHVQDKPVDHTTELFDGNLIHIGNIKLRVRYE